MAPVSSIAMAPAILKILEVLIVTNTRLDEIVEQT